MHVQRRYEDQEEGLGPQEEDLGPQGEFQKDQ